VRLRPLVSCIIPTCNRADLLKEAIESVLAQEGRGDQFDLELIVVDDASIDQTTQLVARYALIQYIRLPEKRGAPAARNLGAAASHGHYVAFLDDDDLWLPRKLHLQVAALEAHEEYGAINGKMLSREPGVPDRIAPAGPAPQSGMVFRDLLRRNICGGPLRFLLRRGAFDTAGPWDETLLSWQDYDLWLRLAYHFPIMFTSDVVGIYRPSPTGLHQTAKAAGTQAERLRRITEKALALLPDSADNAVLRREARAWTEARIVTQLTDAQDHRLARFQILESIGRCPSIVHDSEVADAVAAIIRRCAVVSQSPIRETEAFTAKLQETAAGRSTLRFTGAIWAEVTRGLLMTPSHRSRAWPAVVRVARYSPIQFCAILSDIARRVIRRVVLGVNKRATQSAGHTVK
jgi:hypothetical protein